MQGRIQLVRIGGKISVIFGSQVSLRQNHRGRLWTWLNPSLTTRNQIDYFTISQRYRNAVHNAKAYPGVDW